MECLGCVQVGCGPERACNHRQQRNCGGLRNEMTTRHGLIIHRAPLDCRARVTRFPI